MTALDEKFRPLATRLIAKFGSAITYTTVTAGTYSTSTSEVTNTEASVSTYATIAAADETSFKGGTILTGDKKFTIPAEALTAPKAGDKITLSGIIHAVIDVREIWSGEQIAAYVIQGRT